ncbi:MAG TPA: hypothetical protein VHM70_16360 [Polyangiaceae bacterium]|nr:hypothetical protein [Polyangiaceae bacterium]
MLSRSFLAQSTLRVLAVQFASIVALSFCGCSPKTDGGDKCDEGGEGCGCFGNGTCLEGLECLSHVCVDTHPPKHTSRDGGGEGDAAAASPAEHAQSDGGDAPSSKPTSKPSSKPTTPKPNETDPSSTEPTTQKPNPSTPSGDDSASSDAGLFGGGVPTVEVGPTSGDEQSDASAGSNTPSPDPSEPAPTTTEPTPQPTEPGPSDPSPDACTGPSGTCADGNAMDCADGSWVARDCSACNILSCGIACCGSIWGLVAESYPYEERNDLLASFAQTDEYAVVTANFESTDEFAAIGFTFPAPQPISLTALSFTGTITATGATVEVSLEYDDTTGCLYTSSGGILASEVTCWGDWEDVGYGGSANKLLIRLRSTSSQQASLEVRGVSF